MEDVYDDLEPIDVGNGTSNKCMETTAFQTFQYIVDEMLLAACMAATVFNVIVIYCAVRLFKKSGDTMHLFIISMTLGDLLLTVFCHPQEFLTRRHEVLRHIHLCAVIHFCNWLGLGVSGLSLTMLNVDKLIYFQWPLSYDRAMSKTRAVIFCVLIWMMSLAFVSYGWIKQIISVSGNCTLAMSDGQNYFYETFMVLFCVLPVTSSMFVSGYLFRLTRQKRHAPVNVGGSLDTPTFKNKMKSLVFIFATTAWTSFSLLPYRIFNLVRLQLMKEWEAYDCDQKMMLNWFAWPLVYLLTINPIVNPLITAIIYAPYRITIKKLLIKMPLSNRPLYSYKGDQTEQSRNFCTSSSSSAASKLIEVKSHICSCFFRFKKCNFLLSLAKIFGFSKQCYKKNQRRSCGSVRRNRLLRSTSLLDHELVNFGRPSKIRNSVNSNSDYSWGPFDSVKIKKSDHTNYVYAERTKSNTYPVSVNENDIVAS